jgi:hypothetical protein
MNETANTPTLKSNIIYASIVGGVLGKSAYGRTEFIATPNDINETMRDPKKNHEGGSLLNLMIPMSTKSKNSGTNTINGSTGNELIKYAISSDN